MGHYPWPDQGVSPGRDGPLILLAHMTHLFQPAPVRDISTSIVAGLSSLFYIRLDKTLALYSSRDL